MRDLSTAELFLAWEQGLGQPLIVRNMLLLCQACGVNDLNMVAQLSIGERDARLLQLREWVFGSKMYHITNCPFCSEKIEWETTTSQMRVQHFGEELSQKKLSIDYDGFQIKYRLVNSLDILNLLKNNTPIQVSKRQLLFDCIMEVKKEGELLNENQIPDNVLNAMEEVMSVQDQMADIRMDINCPVCSRHWQSGFDILGFLWAEINNWAQHLMQEIFLLARFFNWSEKDILALSPRRRQMYLQMIST